MSAVRKSDAATPSSYGVAPRAERWCAGPAAVARLWAELIRARCENACGKLPSWRRSCGSYSSPGVQHRSVTLEDAQTARSPRHTVRGEHSCRPAKSCRLEKRLLGRQAVNSFSRVVPQNKSIPDQRALNCRDGAADAGIIRRQKPTKGTRRRLASRAVAPKDCTNAFCFRSKPYSEMS